MRITNDDIILHIKAIVSQSCRNFLVPFFINGRAIFLNEGILPDCMFDFGC